jgi:anti-sigma-K factor RskA
MNCDRFQADYLAEGPTDIWGRHLATCDACRAAQPELAGLRSTLAAPELWETPSDSVERAILAAITGSPEATTGASGRRHWWIAAAASVAAVTVVAVGALTLLRDQADWSVELAAADSFGGASAVVDGWNTDTGTRMEVEVTGIPATGDTGYYEVWMTAPDGEHVSAGTFRSSGTITVWSGVTRRDFPRIWITFETDGDPAPTGAVVFDT